MIGSTCDTVVSSVVGPTRSPICALAIAAMPSIERGDAGEAQVQLGALDRGLGGGQRRLGRVARAQVVVELTLGDGALLGERPIAREVALALGELGAGLGQPRLGLAQRRFERPPIDLEEQLALPDEGALRDRRAAAGSRTPAGGSAR